MLYIDTDFPAALIPKYELGQIIQERGFTDTSKRGGGLLSNFRYLIASAKGRDLSMFDPNAAKWGLIVLSSGSYFKLLDRYRKKEFNLRLEWMTKEISSATQLRV